jgi:8-oxo-dGTP pyrophosphatase MutT (NUDIX family)
VEENQKELLNTVCIILINNRNEILTVSRKNNYNDLGLIGGKVEPADNSPELAAIREAKEETNLDIYDLTLIDKRIHNDELIFCYVAKYKGFIKEEENGGKVKWSLPESVICDNCTFNDYNKIILKKLNLI